MGKSADCIAAIYGALESGHVFSCLNPKFRGPQISAVLQASNADAALVDGPGLMTLRNSLSDPACEAVRQPEWLLLQGDPPVPLFEKATRELSGSLKIRHFNEPPAEEPSTAADDRHEDAHLPACCLFTSGSTGTPKGVLISRRDLENRTWAEVEWFELGSEDVLLSILPFSFDVGLNQLMTALAIGCELVLADSWLPADILDTAAARRVSGISGVPSIWQDMLRVQARFDTAGKHKSLRYITVSGGSLPSRQLLELPGLAPGVAIFKTYGQTEAFRAASLRPSEFSTKSESVGRAFTGVRLYVVNESGRPCAPGEIGEIVHSGLGVMTGYLQSADTALKLRPNPFFSAADSHPLAVFTGDYGCIDDDGYLFLRGRHDTMLKISGNRVYPEEITRQLLAIPGVAMAEVVGVRDDSGESHLAAFASLAKGAALSEAEIQRSLAARLPSYMAPRRVLLLEEMPRTASGKPDKQELLALARRSVNL